MSSQNNLSEIDEAKEITEEERDKFGKIAKQIELTEVQIKF